MRVAFVVNSTRTQRATYTTMARSPSSRRRGVYGHEVRFVGVDGMSSATDDRVFAQATRLLAKPPASAAELEAAIIAEKPHDEICLNEFDVVLLRNNPHVGEGGDRHNPAIDFGRRLKRGQVLVVNDPDGLLRAGSKMYMAGFPEEIQPRTLISRNIDKIREFLRELDGPAIHQAAHAGYGGLNVFMCGAGRYRISCR